MTGLALPGSSCTLRVFAATLLLVGLCSFPATGATTERDEAASTRNRQGGTIRGKVVADGKPATGAQVHAFANPSGGFRGEGTASSSPTAADGSFSLDLPAGSWYLIARGPLPELPGGNPEPGELFGFYGANPVTLGVGGQAVVNVQAVRRQSPATRADPTLEKAVIEGIVTGPEGPVEGASVHVYTDASRQFRGPDLFGPQGAVVGGSGAAGDFSIELPPGTYYLVASKRKGGEALGPLRPGDLHGWFDGNPLTVVAGTKTTVKVQVVSKLRETPSAARSEIAATGIRGLVRDPGGKVPPGVYAFATTDPSFMIGAMPPYRSLPAGPDGSYSIDLPAGGTYYVSARTGYGGPPLPGEWHGFHGEGKPAAVTVVEGRTTESIDIVVRMME